MDSTDINYCPNCGHKINPNSTRCENCGEPVTQTNLSNKTTFGTFDFNEIIKQSLSPKYEIFSVVGRGGMASVYKAKQKTINRFVALKIIHLNLIHDEEFLDRFKREAQIGAKLNHNSIVKVYDVGNVGTVNFMAMEYIEGEDLHRIIKAKGKLTVEETVDYILQIADALNYAHRMNIIHRDIKSSNIIITQEGRAVLTDFGIAHAASSSKLTKTGTIIGTPEYMSPEQASGDKVDAKSDIYSLGIVMYECLTGNVPFRAENPLTLINKIIVEKPKRVNVIDNNIPSSIADVLDEVLEKDKGKRINGDNLVETLKSLEETKNKNLEKQEFPKKSLHVEEQTQTNKTVKLETSLDFSSHIEENKIDVDVLNNGSQIKQENTFNSWVLLGIPIFFVFFIILFISNLHKETTTNIYKKTYSYQQQERNRQAELRRKKERILNSISEIKSQISSNPTNEVISEAYRQITSLIPKISDPVLKVKANDVIAQIAKIYENDGDKFLNRNQFKTALRQYLIAKNILPYYDDDLEQKIKSVKSKSSIIRVPNVVGLYRPVAIRKLRNQGLRVKTLKIFSNKKGYVVMQKPSANNKIKSGKTVIIWVGK